MTSPFRRIEAGYGALCRIRNALVVIFAVSGSAWAEPVTIAALGDSLTQGYGLPADEGFVPQLQGWLVGEGHDVVLINAGVSGDTTAGGLSRIAWTLTEDVDAVIVALGGNDMLRGIDPATARSNLDGILSVAGEAGLPVLLVGMEAPSNYGPDYKAAFDAMYPELADIHDVLLNPNFLGALTAMEDRAMVLQTYMQPDAIHPNAKGVALIVGALGPSVVSLLEQVK